MAKLKNCKGVRKEILSYLEKSLKRDLPWLAEELEMNYAATYWHFCTKKTPLSQKMLSLINSKLNKDFKQ